MGTSMFASSWRAAVAACAALGAAQFASAQVNENFETISAGSLPGGWTTAVTGSGVAWTTVSTQAHAGTNSVFVPNPATLGTSTLTLPSFAATASGPITIDLWRRVDTEALTIATGFDGMRVQVKLNAGAFANIDNRAWTFNGYNNHAISQPATAAAFGGAFPIWTHSIASFYANSGDTVQIQFVFASDTSAGRGGVWIDDLVITSAAGGSCCDATSVCTIRTSADCSGTFNAGSSCTAAPCSPVANDTCAGAIPLTLNVPVLGSNVAAANDYQLTAANPPFIGLVQTTTTAPGRDSVFTFTPPTNGNYSFRLTYGTISTMAYDTTQNMVLYIADTCPSGTAPITIPTANVLAASNRNATTTSACEEIHNVALTAGTQYWIYADQLALLAGSTFYLEAFPSVTETEPNDSPATANVYALGTSGMEGSIGVTAEADFYTLGTPAVGSRVFALVDGNASNSNAVLIKVTTAADTLEADTGNAEGPYGTSSSVVAGTVLTGVESFLRISGSSTTTLYQPYRLYAVVQPGIGSAIPETEPNDEIAQANSNAANYFYGSISSSADTDTYSFIAAQGALVFAALDADPLRDNTPFNGAIELWDSNGAVVDFANDSSTASSITAGTGTLTSTTPNSPGEAIAWRVRSTGTYYLRVRTGAIQPNSFTAQVNPTGDYLLSIVLANNNLGPGACCNNAGGCSVVAGTSCLSPSLFQGVGTTCPGGLCPNSVGACCLASGGCNYLPATSCVSPSAFQGSNTTCGAVTCPASGSCCSGAACTIALSTTCAGTFTAAGSCSPNLCAASCCDSGGACTLVPAAGPCSGTLNAAGSVCLAVVCGPANDTCGGATLLTAPTGVSAQTIDARGALPDVGLSCNTAGFTSSTTAGVWYKAVVPAGDDYVMTFGESATTDAVWGVFTGTCGTLTQVGCFAGDTANTFAVSAGQTYYLLLGVQGTSAQPTLNPTYNVTISFAVVTGACCTGSSCAITAATACTGFYAGANTSCVGGPQASESPAIAIPDAVETTPTSVGTVVRTLSVAGSGTVSDLVVTVGITHTFVGDVRIRLTAPNAVSADLLARPGGTTAAPTCPALFAIGNGNDLGGVYTFTDAAATGVNAAALATTPLPSGSYRAQGCDNTLVSLNTVFGGAPVAGTWTLTVTDEDSAITGTLNSWSLTINGGLAPPCTLAGACCVGPACSLVASSAGCAGTFTLGTTSCTPTPCSSPAGVCCRGAACTTGFADQAACDAAGPALQPGASNKFVVAAACNTAGVNTSPCCYANYNHNASLEVQDIFDFLNDWFAGKKIAIPGGDGSTGTLAVQNIFDFLNAWFAGGCS